MYAQIGIHHRGSGIFAHAASAEVVAAADATKARTTPHFLRSHRVKDVFGLLFHPVGKAPLVLSQVAGDAHEREPKPAAISVSRVQIEEVGLVGQRLGLEPNRDVLIAGYDNYWAECEERVHEPSIPLVTADKRNREMGQAMVEALFERVHNPSAPPQSRFLAPQIVAVDKNL